MYRPSSGPNIWAHMQKSPFCGRIHIAVRQRVPDFYTSTRVRGWIVRQYGFPFNPRPHCWMTFGSHMSKQELQHVTPEGAYCFVSLCLPIAQSDVESHDILFPVFPIALRA